MAYSNPSHLVVEVERILLTEWDPAGVKGEPLSEGDYGSFAGVVTSMLVNGSNEDAVADYLERVESEKLIGGPHPERCHKAAHECRLLLA